MKPFSGRTSTTSRYSRRGGRSLYRRFRRKRQTRCDRPKSRLEVGEALVEVVLGVLVVGVLLELRLGHRAQERLHAHLALDVHRFGVALQLRACGRRKRSGQRVGQTRARWVMIRRTRNHPHRRGGVRRGPRSGRAQEPGAARAVATAAANCRGESIDRSSSERTRHAPLEAFCALASLSARALADFCALPPPIVTVGRRVRRATLLHGWKTVGLQGVRLAKERPDTEIREQTRSLV